MTPAAALVITAVVSVGQAVMSMKQAHDQKKQASRREELEKERLDLQAKERAMETARNKARVRREARARRASILNRGASNNVLFSTPVQGAFTATGTAGSRELGYLDQKQNLAEQADAVTTSQIELDADTARNNAINKGISGVLDAAGSFTQAVSNPNFPSFSSTSNPDTGITGGHDM